MSASRWVCRDCADPEIGAHWNEITSKARRRCWRCRRRRVCAYPGMFR